MAKQTSAAASGGIGFTGLLAVAFIVLKLTGAISWSWWWVLAPLWLPIIVGLVLIAVSLVYLKIQMKKDNESLHQW